ncbi:hypothetical protein [Poritiphilus flavus]|uniref:Uncharacterized protein n=1 Tax=Poritiphilus flavus TaxID=2697053 RepID=A0A6L9ECZ1_9FLAO|nr:hypothetical protein [Poritiphilus flavus]NAS12249.1 hypothetical protein [Poritiphilus flavus]
MKISKSSNHPSNLNELIKDAYGTREQLAEVLNLGIEMLFYLEEDTFERKDVQHVASAIRLVREVLIQSD